MRFLLALLLALPLVAQIRTYRTGMDVRGSVDMRNSTASWPFRSVTSVPSGACTNAAEWVQYTTTGDLYRCVSGTWALFAPAATVTWGSIGGTLSAQADISAALALKAPLASPTFTGSVNLPTPATNDNSTLGATTAWVKAQNYLTAAPVTTVFGRTGAVVATTGDYAASQVTNALDSTASYSNPTWLTGLAWSKITGAPTFADTAGSYSNPAWVTALAWSKITGAPTFLQSSNNLSDLGSAATARTNLGLGTAATSASTAFEPAITSGTTTQFWRGDKSWAAIKSTNTFASTTSLSIPAATHGFATCGLVVRLWDNSSPRKSIEPDAISCNTSTFDLTITFATSQAGLYVVQ